MKVISKNELINQLYKSPTEKNEELSDCVEIISERFEETRLIRGLTDVNINSNSFAFLNEGKDLYPIEDLKEIF